MGDKEVSWTWRAWDACVSSLCENRYCLPLAKTTFFTETRQQQEGVGIRGGFLCLKARGKDCRGIKVGGIVLDEGERHVGEGKRVRSLGTGSPILQCSNQAPGRGEQGVLPFCTGSA